MSAFRSKDQTLAAGASWWDGCDARTFFRTVYLCGDDSLEGWVEAKPLTLAERTEREALGVLRLAELSPEDTIVDCPSGYGRHSLFLAERGFRVVGVDRNPDFIGRAEQSARVLELSMRPHFIQGDMRALPLASGVCSAALNLVLSFGFFDSDEDNMQVLREFARVLRVGGRVVIHTDINPARVRAGTYGDRPVRTLRDGSKLRIQESFDPGTRRLNGSWEIIDPRGASRRAHYSVRVYELEELRQMLQETGFGAARIFGGLDLGQEEPSALSQEVIVLARRER
jgi:SAM-dependent methyltransferase